MGQKNKGIGTRNLARSVGSAVVAMEGNSRGTSSIGSIDETGKMRYLILQVWHRERERCVRTRTTKFAVLTQDTRVKSRHLVRKTPSADSCF